MKYTSINFIYIRKTIILKSTSFDQYSKKYLSTYDTHSFSAIYEQSEII